MSNLKTYLCSKCGLLLSNWKHKCKWAYVFCKLCGRECSEGNYKRHLNPCRTRTLTSVNKANTLKMQSGQVYPLKKKRKCGIFDRSLREQSSLDANNIIKTAINDTVVDIFIKSNNTNYIPDMFLENEKIKLLNIVNEYISKWNTLKIIILLECTYKKEGGSGLIERTDINFKTKMETVDKSTNLEKFITNAYKKILVEIDEFMAKGSGWTFASTNYLCLRLTKYSPLSANSYIELPKVIKNKRAIINVKNINSDDCFRLAILSKRIGSNDPNSYRNVQGFYSFDDILYPTSFKDILKFEKVNNVSINIFALDDKNKVYPLRISKKETYKECFDLMFLEKDNNSHYCLIVNLPRLVNSQITNSHHSYLICRRCFKYYPKNYITRSGQNAYERLKDHELFCKQHKPVRSEFPKDNYITFKNVEFTQDIKIVVYADFETFLVPIAGSNPNPQTSWTRPLQSHEVFCAALMVKSSIPEFDSKPVVYTGSDCMIRFMKTLQSLALKADEIYSNIIPIETLSDEQEHLFATTNICVLCQNELGEGDRVKHHCHITSRFIGAAHNSCNLRASKPDFIPVFLHNFSNFDSHFIVKYLGIDQGNVEIIPSNSEKYMSISKTFFGCKTKIRFVDSYKFLSSSLETLVNNMKSDSVNLCHTFPHLKQLISDEYRLSLISQKGIYPYNYMDSYDKLEETRLPQKDSFYNSLTNKHISNEDYAHAQLVWSTFQIKNMREYTELYIKTDVILLCEVFETFRSLSLKIYGLDPAWCYTLPQLAWNVMLRMTKIKLLLLKDMDMILFIEKGLRGGLVQVVTRHAKANNPYIYDYDPEKANSYILYVDVNNLYGYAMAKSLPYDDFEWVENDINILEIPENSEFGYILDVDVSYPPELHDFHSQFPLLPESRAPPRSKNNKLMTTLLPKSHYIVHYENLKQAVKLGLRIEKINRILKFRQKKWLVPYIEINSQHRSRAKTTFESDFYKIMVNSVFGKSMENIRNRVDIQIVTNETKLNKLVKKPNFKDRQIFAENVIAVHMEKEKIVFNKPIYVGFTILELSKTLMYDYHYNVFIKKYGVENIKLCYTDTDSFIYHINTNNIYNDIQHDLHYYFDTSNYPNSHHCYSSENKKAVGLLKDETAGIPIVEFVGLRPKMYSYAMNNGIELKKAKGVKKCVVNEFTFDDYKKILHSNESMYSSFQAIQSKKHCVQSVLINKMSLSSLDDKRFILENGIDTVPYGHQLCKEDLK